MYVKGQSGNPNGRPRKEQSLTDLLKKYITGQDEGDTITRKEKFIQTCYAGALKGDTAMAKYIWDRMDGSPVQKTENVNFNMPRVIEIGLDDEDNAGITDSETMEIEDEI